MMTCYRCDGMGYELLEEDYRLVKHHCYNCLGSGKVDSETAFINDLQKFTDHLALNYVERLRKSYNCNPDGEGWDFMAAENMMSGSEYFTEKVLIYQDKFYNEISALSIELQEALIESYIKNTGSRGFLPPVSIPDAANTIPNMEVWCGEDDNIPF